MIYVSLKYTFLLVFLINVCYSDDTVEVKLDQGVVIGKTEKTIFKEQNYFTFKGIPYAAAPVGELRFKPPIPHEKWAEKLKAFEDKPTCMQFSARTRLDERYGISGSEDCLFISIFTPNLHGTAPVVIFDYNDSFRTSFNGTKTYSPENFVEEDVVVVTISHRLFIFGYLTTEDEVMPGNNGIRDYIFGLEWVKNNIKKFGGNPDKVTLMGSYGGGSLVNMLLHSEKAKGLFSNVIVQSGNAYETTYFYKDSRLKAFELGHEFGIQTNDSSKLLEVLQKASTDELYDNIIKVLAKEDFTQRRQLSVEPFGPVVEGNYPDAVLTNLPEDENIVNDVPVLIGFNSREGLDFIFRFLFDPKMVAFGIEEAMLRFPIRTEYYFDPESKIFKEAAEEIVSFYIESKNVDFTNLHEYAVYAGDVTQGYSLNYAAKKLSASLKSPVFLYMFDFRGQLNENSQYLTRHSKIKLEHWGATLLDELCYLLVCSRIRNDYVKLKKMVSGQSEQKVMKRMVRMWTNFAKTGNPTPIKDPVLNNFIWKPTSKDSGHLEYLHITKKLQMDVNPLGERGKFWDKFLKKYGAMAVDGVVQVIRVADGVKDEL